MAEEPGGSTRFLRSVLDEIIRERNWNELQKALADLPSADVAETLQRLTDTEAVVVFRLLPTDSAIGVFRHLSDDRQEELVRGLAGDDLRVLAGELAADDRTRLLGELPPEIRTRVLEALPPDQRRVAHDLLGYPPGSAGRLMTTDVLGVAADRTVGDVLDEIGRSGRPRESRQAVYVLDPENRLLREVRTGALLRAARGSRVGDVKDRPLVTIPATAPRSDVLHAFRRHRRLTLPVVDERGSLLGAIGLDDALHAAEAESTRLVERVGGSEALNGPYLNASLGSLLKKRGGWLSALVLGEMLTASAMGHYQKEIAHAVVLALFVPLIISSGGNSGSQASTIMVRSLALRDVNLGDWARVLRRETVSGVLLGAWLGLIGFVRVLLWQHFGFVDYGPQAALVASTVWLSLVGVVTFGSVAGSMLPFLLRRVGWDPATSSAPLVATLVDVTGLVIYFSVAAFLLRGQLL